jgi:NADH dehydrogenase
VGETELHIVTGAFGYSGRYIANRLLEKGCRVRTLTNHPPRRDPLIGRVGIAPLSFDEPPALVESLRGAAVLYNTYWVRFSRGRVTHDLAVENSKILIRAAVEAGVRRLVHVSITNPSEDSPLTYFRGKAIVERAIAESGLSYTILRPAILFGGGQDILLNNMAWLLRRLPVFGVFGSGQYRLQPVYVGDLAALAVEVGERTDRCTTDAVGPEILTYNELVRLIARHVGRKARLIRVPPGLGLLMAGILGWLTRDVVVTRDEIEGLMANLLVSQNPPTCPTALSEWLKAHGEGLGLQYHSELARHYRP